MTTTAPQLLPYLERLLDGETVEWKTLGEVFHTRNGYTPSKANEEFWTDGTIPWFRMEDIRANGRILYDSALHITPQAVKQNGLFKANSIILATSATIGEHALLLQDALTNQRFTNFEIKEELKNILLPKFAFYYFFIIDEWCKKHTIIGNFPSVDTQKLMELPFPIPPLRVQARIVEILDKFTQLEAELEAELEARNKQYDFYRNRLLTGPLPHSPNMPHQWEQVPLGSIGEVRMCKRILKQDTTETGEIPFYKIGTFGKSADAFISRTLFEEYKQKYAYPRIGDILISASGTIGRAIEFDGQDAYFQDSNIVWLEHNDSKVLNRFLYYCYQIADWKVSKGGVIARLYNDNIKKTLIPLPPLSEQRRIVEILDRFDTLTNSISEGLPREIALRRKQYEYYRDALLRFPPPAPTA